MADLEASKDFELDGASTVNTWVRNQLRMKPGQAAALVRNVTAMRDLPLVAEAALAGKISSAHVQVFAYGLKHVGLEPMRQFEDVLVQVARDREPGELFEAVKHLKDKVHPEDLDDAWERGMDKEDFQINAVPDGWHINGFLNTVTGAKVKAVIDSISAPRDKDDDRTGSERRVQGFDDLCDAYSPTASPPTKASNRTCRCSSTPTPSKPLPSTSRPRPRSPTCSATITADRAGEARRTRNHRTPPADALPLRQSDFTAFLMKQHGGARQAQILNAGTAKYQPNLLQRRAVIARQRGVCAAPGCNHTHLEIHHTIWWSLGGPTDLDLLVGLCVRCHHLLHRGRLHITGDAVDGFQFTTRTGRSLRKRRRGPYRQAA